MKYNIVIIPIQIESLRVGPQHPFNCMHTFSHSWIQCPVKLLRRLHVLLNTEYICNGLCQLTGNGLCQLTGNGLCQLTGTTHEEGEEMVHMNVLVQSIDQEIFQDRNLGNMNENMEEERTMSIACITPFMQLILSGTYMC